MRIQIEIPKHSKCDHCNQKEAGPSPDLQPNSPAFTHCLSENVFMARHFTTSCHFYGMKGNRLICGVSFQHLQ